MTMCMNRTNLPRADRSEHRCSAFFLFGMASDDDFLHDPIDFQVFLIPLYFPQNIAWVAPCHETFPLIRASAFIYVQLSPMHPQHMFWSHYTT